MSRRTFFKNSVTLAAGLVILQGCHSASGSGLRFLTDQERELVDALVEQIIPTDQWPGGKDAGVTNFIDKQLVGPYRRHQSDYRTGLDLLQKSSMTEFGKKFENLPFDLQTQVLIRLEGGKFQPKIWPKGLDRKFFSLLKNHSLQGYYGSPRHGGNKDYVSYKMMNLDYPVIIGQNRYKS